MMERIKTGLPGFDKLIEGGFVENSVNLMCGGTGTGKTIFSMQFLLNGAKDYNEKGIYFSLEETEENIRADASAIGLDFSKVSSKIKFVYITPYSSFDFISTIKDEIQKFKAKRVVVDSISALVMPLEDDFERRKQIFILRDTLKEMNCTSLCVSEVLSDSIGLDTMGTFSRYNIEEFLCDSVIVLHYAGIGGESDRAIRVVKMRRTNHIKGPVPIVIEKGGIRVSKSKF